MRTAMVVDDSWAIRLILARTLGKLGVETRFAGNGREAMEVLREAGSTINLVLVDWNMPEMTGIDFIREVRSTPEYDRLALMMVTTETQAEQMMEALAAGADEYVMKPFTDEIIADKLRLIDKLRDVVIHQPSGTV
jgi:two-component system, chemotaxis family, chemotaxis protein CheY